MQPDGKIRFNHNSPLFSGKWLLPHSAAVIALAVLCAYAAFCLLFIKGAGSLSFILRGRLPQLRQVWAWR